MSKHNKPVVKPEVSFSPELSSTVKGGTPDAPPKQATQWVVLEDRTVAISGSITKVRTGKIIKDRIIAEALTKQGVKLEARAV
jgi:hypothetical protein